MGGRIKGGKKGETQVWGKEGRFKGGKKRGGLRVGKGG